MTPERSDAAGLAVPLSGEPACEAVALPSGLMSEQISVTREIDAPAEKVWAMVSDLPRMGEWSPENVGGEWIRGASGPALGALFKGKNRNGFRRWSTTAKVVDCQPGSSFEIAITSLGVHVASWRYDFQETSGGCKVT